MQTKFNPSEKLMSIKGQEYLEVKWRLVWFREEHPDWGIETEVVERGNGWALCKATIKNAEGRVIATAHKAETKHGFADYLEKSETSACGRALAMCGYGTQFTGDELAEGERIVDAPVENGAEQIEGHADGELATYKQVGKLGQLLGTRMKLRTPEEQHAWVKEQLDKEVTDLAQLSKHEASALISGILEGMVEKKHQEPLEEISF